MRLGVRPNLGRGPLADRAESTSVSVSCAGRAKLRKLVTTCDSDSVSAGLPGVVPDTAAADPGRVVFVFPGQGAQWACMGRELAACSPVFAAKLAECARALAPHVGWDLQDVIEGAENLDSAEVTQPVLWAVMVALAAVWQAAGVTPDAVLGHSQGEIAAATVAGILTLEDAAQVVAVRSRALSRLDTEGGMVSVVMPEQAVREMLTRWGMAACRWRR